MNNSHSVGMSETSYEVREATHGTHQLVDGHDSQYEVQFNINY